MNESKVCPQCGQKMTVDISGKIWYCKQCDNEIEFEGDTWQVVS